MAISGTAKKLPGARPAAIVSLLALLAGGVAGCKDDDNDFSAVAGTHDTAEAFPELTFRSPLFLGHPPDGTDRICVVEQAGRILVFENSRGVDAAKVLLDIRSQVQSGGEEGLLGLAFDPQFAANRRFYVHYIASPPRRSVIARFEVSADDPDAADPDSERILLEVAQPFANHNGGMLAFGPDGLLYLSLGDGGSGGDPQGHGQDLTTLLGSILRIRPEDDGTYSIPADNPFVGRGGGVREEIWAYGLRNPWRFSFDREDGDLWVGDVGQSSREEVSIATRGANLGWNVYEGSLPFNNPLGLPLSDFTAPIAEYGDREGESVIGGYVYRGERLDSMKGGYLCGDFVSGRVWLVTHTDFEDVERTVVATVPRLSSFGEDEAGEVYAVSLEGKIYRFEER